MPLCFWQKSMVGGMMIKGDVKVLCVFEFWPFCFWVTDESCLVPFDGNTYIYRLAYFAHGRKVKFEKTKMPFTSKFKKTNSQGS